MPRKHTTKKVRRKLPVPKVGFWQAYLAFRRTFALEKLDIHPEEFLNNVRDKSPGREVHL